MHHVNTECLRTLQRTSSPSLSTHPPVTKWAIHSCSIVITTYLCNKYSYWYVNDIFTCFLLSPLTGDDSFQFFFFPLSILSLWLQSLGIIAPLSSERSVNLPSSLSLWDEVNNMQLNWVCKRAHSLVWTEIMLPVLLLCYSSRSSKTMLIYWKLRGQTTK